MRFGKDRARPSAEGRRRAFRPAPLDLEVRMAPAIDVATYATAPLGVLEAGLNSTLGVGFSVAEVGDVNGDGFDDFVAGGPTLNTQQNSSDSLGLLGNGSGSQVYLIFGSAQVNSTQAVDFAILNAQQRTGDLGQLGNATQNNPLNGSPGFAYNGLTFRAGQNQFSQLGASVTALGDINGDGFADFMIGAPGANDPNGVTQNFGRAYLVYGGATLSARANKMVDLDNPSANTDLNIITFVSSIPNGRAGRSVAPVGDVLTDGLADVAIGAPGATVNGVTGGGAVIVVSGGFLRPARTQTVDLANVGQGGTNNVPGVLISGATPNEQLGVSVSTAGNFDGARTSVGQPIFDLLMGAPNTPTGAGTAYLVYGGPNLAAAATTVGGVTFIPDNIIGTTLPGAVFNGAAGDVAGFSVAAAGDFNNDGLGDIMIGAPRANGDAGRVNLIEGRAATPTTPGRITGTFDLTNLPADISSITFNGATAGDRAGFSESAVGRINADNINEIAIGAPGVASMTGAVFLIPGNPDLLGPVTLSPTGIEVPSIAGQTLTLSQPLGQNFFGTSVSSLIGANRSGNTIDGDGIGDLIIGAAGYSLNSARNLAGAAFALEGRFIPLGVPVSTAIHSNIGVGQPLPPFQINAQTPADLDIFIESKGSNNPNFQPFRDINPDTIQVNGVALPDPGTFRDAGDVDGDGIDDAVFTFSPRSLLGLTNATTQLTVTARTNTGSPVGSNVRYSGTATISVTGGGGGGGGLPQGKPVFIPPGGFQPQPPPFGERFIPQPQILGKLYYKPLPVVAAYRQFLPRAGFAQRVQNLLHPKSNHRLGTRHRHGSDRTSTLGREVFTRGHFKAGQLPRTVHHGKGPFIPPAPK